MNHQLKEEEVQEKRKIDLTVFKSPGISIIEHDITILKSWLADKYGLIDFKFHQTHPSAFNL